MKNKTNITLKVMQLVTLFFFLCLFLLLGKVMLFDQKKHENNLLLLTNKEVLGESAPRGRIYDRNHKLLVDNMACKVIKYQKSKKITVKKEIELAYELSKIIDLDLQKLTIRSKKDFYLVTKVQETKSLITAAEWELYYRKLLSNKDIEDLKIDRITDQMLKEFTKEDEKAALLYYLMNKGYSYDEKTIKRNITNEEYAYIAEHASSVGGFFVDTSWERIYLYGDTFRPLLGTVSSEEDGIPLYRIKDLKEKGYALNDRIGISYLEKEYEDYLRGEKALYKINSNYHKELKRAAVRGNDLVLTIDIDLQRDVENILKEEIVKAKLEPNTKYYDHSYVILTDPLTGEILAISGKKLNDFEIVDYTTGILTNPVTAGSVVKGASILVGYDTKVLKIGDVIKDECIKIANTPKKCSWKTLGDVNDIKALAMSSNIYQFKVAMKVANANYQYNQPLKIDEKAFSIYRDMYNRFGLGVKTEIDLPEESIGYIGTSKLPGHLLDLVMGQYDTYTPLQLSQYITTLANGKERLQPHFLKEVHEKTKNNDLGKVIYAPLKKVLNKIDVDDIYINRVKEGFYAVTHANYGIGHNYIDNKYDGAGKTGTSQSFIDTNNDGVIDKETITTAFVGYAPKDNPKISIVVVSPSINNPHGYSESVSQVTKRISYKVTESYFSKHS